MSCESAKKGRCEEVCKNESVNDEESESSRRYYVEIRRGECRWAKAGVCVVENGS